MSYMVNYYQSQPGTLRLMTLNSVLKVIAAEFVLILFEDLFKGCFFGLIYESFNY